MDWAALRFPAGWKRIGREYHGPCPVTGEGKDRAWVQPDEQTLGCRGCGPEGDGGLGRGELLKSHAEALGIWTAPRGKAARSRSTRPASISRMGPAHPGSRSRDGALEPAASHLPARVWAAGVAVAGTPGALYLGRPDRLGEPWPGKHGEHVAVRWVRSAGEGAGMAPRWPTGAVGGLAYLFAAAADRGAAHAVQVEAVDGAGRRLEGWLRWNPDRGAWEERPAKRVSVSGSRFGQGRRVFVGQWASGSCWVVEGPLDALAMARRLPASTAVLRTMGTSAFTVGAVDAISAEVEIVIAADGDGPGRDAARGMAGALKRAGRRWRIRDPGAGLDWCDALAVARDEREEREAMRDE